MDENGGLRATAAESDPLLAHLLPASGPSRGPRRHAGHPTRRNIFVCVVRFVLVYHQKFH